MRLASLWGLFLSVALATTATADLVLMVDVSNPAAVLFTATNNVSQVNDASATAYDGVTLLSFFTSDPTTSDPLTGNLTPAGPAAAFNYTTSNNTYVATEGLNLNNGTSTDALSFSTSTAAFTGSAVANLTGQALPAPGTSGDVVVGDLTSGSGAVIGQWEVTAVPEPSAFLLLALAGVPVAYRRWRKS